MLEIVSGYMIMTCFNFRASRLHDWSDLGCVRITMIWSVLETSRGCSQQSGMSTINFRAEWHWKTKTSSLETYGKWQLNIVMQNRINLGVTTGHFWYQGVIWLGDIARWQIVLVMLLRVVIWCRVFGAWSWHRVRLAKAHRFHNNIDMTRVGFVSDTSGGVRATILLRIVIWLSPLYRSPNLPRIVNSKFFVNSVS